MSAQLQQGRAFIKKKIITPVSDLTGTTWVLNQNITNTVPNGSDWQQLIFNYYCEVSTTFMSNACIFVAIGYLTPFSTWQQLISQFPTLLSNFGATNISSTLSASNVPSDYKTKLSASNCEFIGSEEDGYWFSPNAGFDITYPTITGTISFTIDGASYTLTFLEFVDAIYDYTETQLFDTAYSVMYDLDGGYADDDLRTWHITGGNDATDSDLIAWLQQNAVLQPTPHYLTWNEPAVDVRVNGNTVSQGYELQDGDIITAYCTYYTMGTLYAVINNQENYLATTPMTNISLQDTNIYINYLDSAIGGSND